MINLKSLINEVHLQDLFHATYHSNLLKMLNDNAIKLGFPGGTKADMLLNKGYPFFLSTMRQKYGNFARGRYDQKILYYDVVIQLDGRALTASGFKIFPVDFWGMGREASEQEERIVSDKDEITPLSKFIKSVHMYVDTKIKNPYVLERLVEINKIAKTLPFPIYFYLPGNEEYFKSHRTEKAVRDLDGIIQSPQWSDEDLEHKKQMADRDVGDYHPSKQDVKFLQTFIDLYNEKPLDDSVQPVKRIMNWVLYYPHDMYSQMSTTIHNLKKYHPTIFREIVSIMKKAKFKTVHEWVTFVIERERLKRKQQK